MQAAGKVYIEQLIERLIDAHDVPVLRHQGRDITGGEFLGSIFRYARALSAIGISRGKLVALFAPNNPDALAIRYATNLLGAGAIYLPAQVSSQSRFDLLARLNPSLLVLFSETAHLVPSGVTAKTAGVGKHIPGVSIHLDELAATQTSEVLGSSARPEDLGVIISSGGTTGTPKSSWRTFSAYTAMVHTPSNTSRIQLINGPLAYLSQVLVDVTLLGGGIVVLEKHFDAASTLATIEAQRITDLFLVEPQLFEVMDHPDVTRRDLSSLQMLTHIGASAPPTLRRRAWQRLGPVLTHTYGASEIGLVSTLSPAEHDVLHSERFACAGRIRPGVEVRFRRKDGTLASAGDMGIIEVRSHAMAGGYYGNPELEVRTFLDGWYRTSDIGMKDKDGYLYICGREGDLTRDEDNPISLTLIEDVLCQLPSVRFAVAVPERHTELGIVAVVPWPEQTVDLSQCRDAIAGRFGATIADLFLLIQVGRVPLTEQGKPDRGAIVELGRASGKQSTIQQVNC